LPGKRLRVSFSTGAVKIYDCTPLLSDEPFAVLRDDGFFRNVHADDSGYGVSWTDEVDLSESELWLNGVAEPAAEEERTAAPAAARG